MMRTIVGLLSALLLAACADATGPTASRIAPTESASQRLSGERKGKPRASEYGSVRDAAAAIEKHVKLPILVPDDLRNASVQNVDLREYAPNVSGATLTLKLPDGSAVTLDYGAAAGWGCGDGAARPDQYVRIGAHRGVLRNMGAGWWSLHWPATRQSPDGLYGISAKVPRNQLLRWARSMMLAGDREVSRVEGC